MPPYELWLRGRDEILAVLADPGRGVRRLPPRPHRGQRQACLRPVPAAAPPGAGHDPWALQILDIVDGELVELSFFLDTETPVPALRPARPTWTPVAAAGLGSGASGGYRCQRQPTRRDQPSQRERQRRRPAPVVAGAGTLTAHPPGAGERRGQALDRTRVRERRRDHHRRGDRARRRRHQGHLLLPLRAQGRRAARDEQHRRRRGHGGRRPCSAAAGDPIDEIVQRGVRGDGATHRAHAPRRDRPDPRASSTSTRRGVASTTSTRQVFPDLFASCAGTRRAPGRRRPPRRRRHAERAR